MTYLYNSKNIRAQRKDLRNNATVYEKRLWQELKGRKLGVKFRRQTSIGFYIVDFYCPSLRLIIEVDGDIHDSAERKEYDNTRTEYFKNLGLREIRFTNKQIETHINYVINKIMGMFSSPPYEGGVRGG